VTVGTLTLTDGGTISSSTTVSVRLSEDTLEATFKGPAGESDTQTCTLAADHTQMTCRGVLTEREGQAVNYVDVYDRRERGDGATGAGERDGH